MICSQWQVVAKQCLSQNTKTKALIKTKLKKQICGRNFSQWFALDDKLQENNVYYKTKEQKLWSKQRWNKLLEVTNCNDLLSMTTCHIAMPITKLQKIKTLIRAK